MTDTLRLLSSRASALALAAGFAALGSACLTNAPDPNAGGIYSCVDSSECPGTQSCLQGTCETITLPVVKILNPEDGDDFDYQGGGMDQTINISVNATDFILRPRSQSTEAVPGEGHLVFFLDEVEVGVIDSGDLGGGVQLQMVPLPDVPGVHRIRVQARFNDGTDYDNEGAAPRNLIWVDDGNEHIAFRSPWPGEVFSLESQQVNAEIAAFGGIVIDEPGSGEEHVHVYYDEAFPACLDDMACEDRYSGVVPSNEDIFGPVIFPESGATMVTLTALTRQSNHDRYLDPNGLPVIAQIQVLRSNAQ